MMSKLRSVIIPGLFLVLISGQVVADDREGELTGPVGQVSGLPFDLLPPGARALGIGGAFTAVADDSTAALANPAGLTNLSAPEVALYLRYTDADVEFLDPDAYSSGLNTSRGQLGKEYSDSSTNISFASFVIPFEKVTLAGFYSNQLDFKADQSLVDSVDDYGDELPFFDTYTNENGIRGKVENFGASLAFRFSEGFSAGLTLRNSKLKLRSQDSWQLDHWNDLEFFMADEYYGGIATDEQVQTFLPVINDIYDYDVFVDDSDNDLVLDLGLYYQGEQWSFGAVYHGESSFKFDTVGSLLSDGSCNSGYDELSTFCEGFFERNPDLQELWTDSAVPNTAKIKIPKYFSFGAAWRPSDTWLISLDINWIDYSALNEPREITQGFAEDINDIPARADYFDDGIRALGVPLTEPIDDEVTFHLGAEKTFLFDGGSLRNISLRAGVFTVKDHDGIVPNEVVGIDDKDDTVWTVGIGSIWGKSEIGAKMFQVDLGASFADDVTNVVLSGIYRF